jgi:hypothetical protein
VGELVDRPLPELIYKPKLLMAIQKIKNHKHKCLSVVNERCLHSIGSSNATIPPQAVCDSFEKLLNPQGLIRSADLKKGSKKRVVYNSKIDNL